MKAPLNIVDENDQIIGVESREKIHAEGLLHREVHVYFVTPEGKIIFQHRAKDKDTFPDLFDATVGGHVEIGQSYEETAVKETLEETGVSLKPEDLIFVKKIKARTEDSTGKINHNYLSVYLYLYSGQLSDLKVESGLAVGFAAWSIAEILAMDKTASARFIPYVFYLVTEVLKSEVDKLLS